ncbi:MAG: hypothetical protein ACREJM_10495, partial [Candidatus Saccharimonadales bacterium]
YWAAEDTAAVSGVSPMAVALTSPVDAAAIPITAHVESTAGKALIIRGTVSISRLALREKSGLHQGSLLFALVSQNAAGAILHRRVTALALRLNHREYAGALRYGISFHQTLALGASAIMIRIVVEDRATGNVGSLIIPLNAPH